MKKRFACIISAIMVFSLFVGQASAVSIDSIGADSNSITVDNLNESLSPYSLNRPTKFYDIAKSGRYKGSFTGLTGGLYTNYYFSPNASGELIVSGSVSNAEAKIKYLEIQCIEMSTKRVISTHRTSEIKQSNTPYYNVFSGLSSQKHYYFCLNSGGPVSGIGGLLNGSINVSHS